MDVTAAIFKVWRQSKISVNAYLLEEHSCQISSRSDLKRRSRAFLKRVSPQHSTRTTKRRRRVSLCDQFQVLKQRTRYQNTNQPSVSSNMHRRHFEVTKTNVVDSWLRSRIVRDKVLVHAGVEVDFDKKVEFDKKCGPWTRLNAFNRAPDCTHTQSGRWETT